MAMSLGRPNGNTCPLLLVGLWAHTGGMKNQRIRICDLAGELHVSSRELVRGANALGINVIRAVASLSSGQEYVLREAVKSGQISRKRQEPPPPPRRYVPLDDPAALREGRCQCCELPYQYKPLDESNAICRDCEPHYERPDEEVSRKLARYDAHATKFRRLMEFYRKDCYEQRELVDAVYAKRDRWMQALVEVVLAHAPDEKRGGCSCGAAEYPCVTRRHTYSVNKGIASRIEELEGMNEREFNRVLYGEDYSHFADWDDSTA